MELYTDEQKENMKKFINQTFPGTVEDLEIDTIEKLQKVYDEACSYSDWGL